MEALNRVPSDLRRLLFDFTLSFIIEKPEDYIQHGLDYFQKLYEIMKRESIDTTPQSSSTESITPISQVQLTGRRQSVIAEKYNPEDDEDEDPVYPKSDEERKLLSESIKTVLLFRVLDRESLKTVTDAMHSREVSPGEVIIEQGNTEADYFYIVQEGTFEALVTFETGVAQVVKTYNNIGSFGELALLYNVPRAATVRAVTAGKLWELGRSTFQRIIQRGAFNKRERYLQLFNRIEFLRELTPYAKLDLADSLYPKYYDDGDVIFLQGDIADGMYFVESGEVAVVVDHPTQGEVVVNELRVGDYFGELALITHNRRALTAVSRGETKLAFLDKDTFERLLGPCTEKLSRRFSEYESQMKDAVGSDPSIYYTDNDDYKDGP